MDCNAANWAHVRRTVLDKAKSEINGHTDIYFDYEVYEKDRQRVIAIAVTIEPVSYTHLHKTARVVLWSLSLPPASPLRRN